MNYFIDWSARSPSRSSAARANARSDAHERRDPRSRDGRRQEVLADAVERHHPRLVMACSFQKEESVLIDMLTAIEPDARVFTIDTGVLFPETLRDVAQLRGPLRPARRGVRRLAARTDAVDAWRTAAARRKVDALERALDGRRRLDHRHPARAVAHARGRRRRSNATSPAGSGSSTRWPTGRRRTCGATSTSTTCPTTRSTTRATPRSAARPCTLPGQRPRGTLGRPGQDRVRNPRVNMRSPLHVDARLTYELSHLERLESEAIHVIREVAAELERPVLLFSGGKDSLVLLRLARRRSAPGRFPFPVMHVDTGHNFPEVIEFRDRLIERARRAADRGQRAGLDRQGPRGRGDRPARLAQPASDRDAARRDRGARLRRRLRRRAPRRGARPGQGAHPLLPRRLRPVGPQAPAPRAVDPLQRPHPQGRARARVPALELDRARRVAVHRARRGSRSRRSTSPTRARCSSATGCSTRSARTCS